LALLLCVALIDVAAAKPRNIAVIPVGKGDAFAPCFEVSKSLSQALTKKGYKVRYTYPQRQAAPDPQKAKEGADLLERAFSSFESLDFTAVQDYGLAAIKLFKKNIKRGADPKDYVEALQHVAAAALFAGDEKGAQKWMNDAILFSEAPPPPKKFNPTVQKLHQNLLRNPKLAGKGTIRFSASPEAAVALNGKLYGMAKGEVELRSGLYLIRVFRPGYISRQRWFRVRKGEVRTFDALLNADPTEQALPTDGLLQEARLYNPTSAVAQISESLAVDEVVLIAPGKDCKESRCKLLLRWAKSGRWIKKSEATYTGNAAKTTEKLLRGGKKVVGGLSGLGEITSCQFSSDCGKGRRCVNHRCEVRSSITRKWWFWTIIGAAAVGAATAAIVVTTQPDNVVIELQ
jgi:hypothetical protein